MRRYLSSIALILFGWKAAASECDSALLLKSLRNFHIEISKNNQSDRARKYPFGSVSRRGSVESLALYDSHPATQGNAVSFGSGPDVHRLLQDYPLVPRLHLVDELLGQGSPGEVIREIEKRLQSIAGQKGVSKVSPGFTNEIP